MKMEPRDPWTDRVGNKIGFDATRPAGAAHKGFLRARNPGFEEMRLQDYLARARIAMSGEER
jgi:hypothetical protein